MELSKECHLIIIKIGEHLNAYCKFIQNELAFLIFK